MIPIDAHVFLNYVQVYCMQVHVGCVPVVDWLAILFTGQSFVNIFITSDTSLSGISVIFASKTMLLRELLC